MKKKTKLLVAAECCVLLFFGFYFLRIRNASTPTLQVALENEASTTPTNLGSDVTAAAHPGAPVSNVVHEVGQAQVPNLGRSVAYNSTLAPEAVAILKEKIAVTVSTLQANPKDTAVWLQLALYYKMAGDYHAAETVWVYITQVSPNDFIAFQNLGDLYQNFLKDYQKAEKNYLAAVVRNPKNIELYRNLYTLYKYQYKTDTTAAADILARGLAASPNNPDLLKLQK